MCNCANCGRELEFSQNADIYFCDNADCSLQYVRQAKPTPAKPVKTVRERIDGLSSPIARALLSAVVDSMENAVLHSIQYPESDLSTWLHTISPTTTRRVTKKRKKVARYA